MREIHSAEPVLCAPVVHLPPSLVSLSLFPLFLLASVNERVPHDDSAAVHVSPSRIDHLSRMVSSVLLLMCDEYLDDLQVVALARSSRHDTQ